VPSQNKNNSRHSLGGGFYWLLVALTLAAFVWLCWPAAKIPAARKSSAGNTVLRPPTNAVRTVIVVTRTNPPPAANSVTDVTGAFLHPVENMLEAQLALDRRGISAGSLDGKIGPQTRAALRAFQQRERIPATGELDAATQSRLLLAAPPLTRYTVTTNDLARLQPVGETWLAKSQQTALDYETILELVAEQSHAHPALIQQLNPGVAWTNVFAGTVLQVPDSRREAPAGKAAFLIISLSGKTLEAFDAETNLVVHFPCSIARQVEKRPVGELHVVVVATNPNYTFDPALFSESPEAQQLPTKLVVPPGPNNPVGLAWIGLDKPGYGIHGAPGPELVGRTESHGCFRLANWNAEYLVKFIWIGMPVRVEP